MSIGYEIRRRGRSAIAPVLCASAIAYFGYHAVEGERGLHAYTRLVAEIRDTRAKLDAATAERQRLERRVELLSSRSLDADMLDEQARLTLGVAAADELVVFLPRR